MEITGYTWEKSCGSFRFMMESWIFKSNIEWKLLVWNVVLPMERFIHIHLDLADYKVIKTNDKHALLKPSVPIHSTRRPVKRNKQTKFLGLPLNLLFWTRKYFKEVSRLSLPLNLLILEMLKSTYYPLAFSTHFRSQEKVYLHQRKKIDQTHHIHLFKRHGNTIHMQEC